jgi:hypothetical protein
VLRRPSEPAAFIGQLGVDSLEMKSRYWLIAVAVLLVAVNPVIAQIGVLPQKDTTLQDATDEKFKVGDVWEYTTRKGEEYSRVTIVKVENSPELGLIVHVAVDKVKLADCLGGASPNSVPHMPFARRALDASVTKRVGSVRPLPDYREGYEEWKQGYSKKTAGIYVVSVSTAVSAAEHSYRSGLGCD